MRVRVRLRACARNARVRRALSGMPAAMFHRRMMSRSNVPASTCSFAYMV